ncbi:MAG: RdgB/HAM1 family non-canonical purine NTP pyrophosphatase [Congregibacter sp.]
MLIPPGDLVVATGNAGKLAEFQRLLAPLPFNLRRQSEFDVIPAQETGLSFVENAILKARAATQQTGLPALADDSGLEVDALHGAPGVRSARYADSGLDEDNNSKLLEALKSTPEQTRSARFHCVLVVLRHPDDPVPLIAAGSWEGLILSAPRGDAGFGYDPLFFVPSHGVSAAELDPAQKNALSHRGIAVRRLLAQLQTH